MTDVVIPSYTPVLFDVHRFFESYVERGRYNPIVGNHKSRMALALAFPLMKIPVMLRGPAGTAKSTIIKAAVTMTWGKDVIDDKIREVLYIAGTSDRGLITETMMNRIRNTCTHCVIPELQNALRDERTEAIIKLWAEGESYSYKRAGNGGRITNDITLPPLPILTSIANENKYSMKLGEEIERRFFPLYTISNTALNREVHKTKADAWTLPQEDLSKMTEDEKTRLRVHMMKASKLNTGVRNPCANHMIAYMPSNYAISNSMIGYWFGLVGAITKFNFTDRISIKRGNQTYFLSTPEDNWAGWVVGGESLIMGCNSVPDLGRDLLDILPLRDQYSPDSAITVNEIMDKMRSFGVERNKNQVRSTLLTLELSNYAKRDESQREAAYYRTEDYPFEAQVDWKTCVKEASKIVEKHFSEIADDYKNRFCKKPKVRDPFSDKKISLLEIPFEPSVVNVVDASNAEKKATIKLDEYFG